MKQSESDLLRRAVEGDEGALVELLEQYGPLVRQKLRGKIDKKWQSVLSEDDVMQETYGEAFLSIRRFEPRGGQAFGSWLATIAKHNLLDAVKGLKTVKSGGDRIRLSLQSPDDTHLQLFENLGVSTTSPSQHAARNEVKELLDHSIEQLPPNYRRVVVLYDLECRPVEEVAADVGCSPGAVYMRRARAHVMLKELLGTESKF